jgi:hypothetical protein
MRKQKLKRSSNFLQLENSKARAWAQGLYLLSDNVSLHFLQSPHWQCCSSLAWSVASTARNSLTPGPGESEEKALSICCWGWTIWPKAMTPTTGHLITCIFLGVTPFMTSPPESGQKTMMFLSMMVPGCQRKGALLVLDESMQSWLFPREHFALTSKMTTASWSLPVAVFVN